MKLQHTTIGFLFALTAVGCTTEGGSDDGGEDGGSSGMADTGTPGETGSTPGSGSDGGTTGGDGSTDGGSADETGGATGGEEGFVFDESPPDAYAQIDRVGMPGVNTAVITSKNEYNASSPADDAAGVFVPEIVANVGAFHDALDDDLTGLGLTPCAVDDCVAQAAPLVVPDTLKLTLGAPSGFPNGRLLMDPVMDIVLAVVLLDLSVEGQTAATFAGLPLNPPANDVAFPSEFPYLAAPHE